MTPLKANCGTDLTTGRPPPVRRVASIADLAVERDPKSLRLPRSARPAELLTACAGASNAPGRRRFIGGGAHAPTIVDEEERASVRAHQDKPPRARSLD
jgi:hypothetical protein